LETFGASESAMRSRLRTGSKNSATAATDARKEVKVTSFTIARQAPISACTSRVCARDQFLNSVDEKVTSRELRQVTKRSVVRTAVAKRVSPANSSHARVRILFCVVN
jgi:hypothetical protein